MSEDDIKDELARLKQKISELEEGVNFERALDRRRISDLELYLSNKDDKSGRRDFDFLAIKLVKEVLRRPYGMSYSDVMNYFRFKSHIEAYRLMEKTAMNFPRELELRTKAGSRKKLYIVSKIRR